MLASVVTAVTSGIEGTLVQVEVDVAPGLPVCRIVGLPDSALTEARERVRSALRNAGFSYPLARITVNLAPAERRKRGSAYDLAIAAGILAASGQVRIARPAALLGELSLGGRLLPVPGLLPLVATLVAAGYRRVVVPAEDAGTAAWVEGAEVLPAVDLAEAVGYLRPVRRAGAGRTASPGRTGPLEPPRLSPAPSGAEPGGPEPADLAEVAGQAAGRRALEIALAGGHHLLLTGSPGAGKTLLARTIPALLPPLTADEAREVALVRSAAGLPAAPNRAPFRAPHHTTSYAALIGGGPSLRPGLVSLAHAGVLFLDELAEFPRDVLDALRQPLEDGTVEVARAHGVTRFPARLQLVAAMNPCLCGWEGDPERPCRCPAGGPERYRRRVSGPLLDRIDLRVRLERVPADRVLVPRGAEASAPVAVRIARARAWARDRNGGLPNARAAGAGLIAEAADLAGWIAGRIEGSRQEPATSRGVVRLLRVARTIADLAGRERIGEAEVLEAIALRSDPFPGGTG